MAQARTQIQVFEELVKARCTIIGIESPEPYRVMDAITFMAGTRSTRRRVMTWSAVRGLYEIVMVDDLVNDIYEGDQVLRRESRPSRDDDVYSMLESIVDNEYDDRPEEIRDLAPEEPGYQDQQPIIFVLHDLHPYFDEPLVVRALRDVSDALLDRMQTVVLVSPNLSLPDDVKRAVKVMSWELPSTEEIDDSIRYFVSENECRCELNGQRDRLISALKGLTESQVNQVLAQAYVRFKQIDERAIEFVDEVKAEIVRNSQALEMTKPEDVGDVGGFGVFKDWALEADAARSPDAAAFGLKPTRGVFLTGVQGCGKSLVVQTLGKLFGISVFRVRSEGLMGSYVGESEKNVAAMCKTLRAAAPCVAWFDEVEKLWGGVGGENDGGARQSAFGVILTEMEKLADTGVFLAATANNVENMPAEFMRRFSERFFVDLPVTEERAEIFAIHIRKSGRDADEFDLMAVASEFDGFTGSEIEEIVQKTLRRLFKAGRAPLTESALIQTRSEIRPLSETMAEKVNAMRAWGDRMTNVSSYSRSRDVGTTKVRGRGSRRVEA